MNQSSPATAPPPSPPLLLVRIADEQGLGPDEGALAAACTALHCRGPIPSLRQRGVLWRVGEVRWGWSGRGLQKSALMSSPGGAGENAPRKC